MFWYENQTCQTFVQVIIDVAAVIQTCTELFNHRPPFCLEEELPAEVGCICTEQLNIILVTLSGQVLLCPFIYTDLTSCSFPQICCSQNDLKYHPRERKWPSAKRTDVFILLHGLGNLYSMLIILRGSGNGSNALITCVHTSHQFWTFKFPEALAGHSQQSFWELKS